MSSGLVRSSCSDSACTEKGINPVWAVLCDLTGSGPLLHGVEVQGCQSTDRFPFTQSWYVAFATVTRTRPNLRSKASPIPPLR